LNYWYKKFSNTSYVLIIFLFVKHTPFGNPVDPLVYIIMHILSKSLSLFATKNCVLLLYPIFNNSLISINLIVLSFNLIKASLISGVNYSNINVLTGFLSFSVLHNPTILFTEATLDSKNIDLHLTLSTIYWIDISSKLLYIGTLIPPTVCTAKSNIV